MITIKKMIKIIFEDVKIVADYVINNNTPTESGVISLLVEKGYTEENASEWVNQFKDIMCSFLGLEKNNDECINWIKGQANLGKNNDTITEQLIGMFGSLLSENEIVVVYKNGKLYKEFAPLNIVKIKFNNIFVNLENEELFVLFKYRDEEYKTKLINSPEKFKKLYKAKCILNGDEIPQELKNTDVKSLDLDDLGIYFDLNNL